MSQMRSAGQSAGLLKTDQTAQITEWRSPRQVLSE